MPNNQTMQRGDPRTIDLKFVSGDLNQTKAANMQEGYIAGWASTPDMDYYGDVIVPGAFDESIAAKGLSGARGIKFLIGHDHGKPAGVITTLETRGSGLWIEAQLNLNISYVRDIYEAAKFNGGFSFSVGFFSQDWQYRHNSTGVEFLQIEKAELTEVSLVVFPANPAAVNTIIKGITKEETFETLSALEKALVACGMLDSRNEAQRVVKLFKRHLHLLQPQAETQAVSQTPAQAPAAKQIPELETLSGILKKFNESLANGEDHDGKTHR